MFIVNKDTYINVRHNRRNATCLGGRGSTPRDSRATNVHTLITRSLKVLSSTAPNALKRTDFNVKLRNFLAAMPPARRLFLIWATAPSLYNLLPHPHKNVIRQILDKAADAKTIQRVVVETPEVSY